ncbi:MAG: peptide-methionine (S)-S-oxide reductase MsrA [Bacteroidia bacterium]|nr:peptide-methionine (S)-S-oxide reductase MsrA [Bacteroidia bacterium]
MAVTFFTAIFFANACGQTKTNQANTNMETENTKPAEKPATSLGNTDTATFGAGCFWCVEAVFQRLNGVMSIKSGYSGGTVKNPSYKEVCNGTTGHAEVCQIVFDKSKISFEELLEVFWKTHDPTTLNSQGNDFGTQYRSAIFYHNLEQKQLAEKYKKELNEAHVYNNPIVTEISPFTNYYPAEDYHQDYFNQNGSQGYCKFVIQPKVEKFEKVFKNKLKH